MHDFGYNPGSNPDRLPEPDTHRTAQVAIIDSFRIRIKRALRGKQVLTLT